MAALVVGDRAQETCTTIGTGTLSLLGAVTQFQSFAAVGVSTGNTTSYSTQFTVADQSGAKWETSIGVYTTSGSTLTRTTVLSSSNGGALVNFGAGTKFVFMDYSATMAVSGGGGGTYPTIQPTLNLDFANSKTVDPRITFVRNSTATYYDGQTTAMAEQNLLLQSQTFATTWVASNATLGSLTTAPDGTTTAYPLTASAINGTLLQTFTATATAYTFSIYIQRVTGTGNIDITVDGTTYATQTTSGTWTRFTITTTPVAGSKTAGIRLATSGDVVNIWGAQLEQRSSATAYTPTTTAAITNYIPQLMTAPAGVPRLDYNPTTGQALGLLIEESRSNLTTYSSDFSNAMWVKDVATVTVTADTIIAPDGTLTGDTITTTVTAHGIYETITVTASTTYTFSWYAKLSTLTPKYSVYNQTTPGDIIAPSLYPTGTSVGNGWFRYSATFTTPVGCVSARIYPLRDSGTTGDIFIWGAQLEAGAFATSYIPTVASTVTRAVDAASMTGTNFSSWYNQAQGSLYAEIDTKATYVGATIFRISDGGANNRIQLGSYTGIASRYLMVTSGANPFIFQLGTPTPQVKVAVTFIVGNYLQAVNGAYTTASTSILPLPIVNSINIGGDTAAQGELNGHIRKISYYPVALSSSNLVALTS